MRTHEYVCGISTDDLSEAIASAEDFLSDLLEDALRMGGSTFQQQCTIELQRALARYREQCPQTSNSDSFDVDDEDDDGGVELVE